MNSGANQIKGLQEKPGIDYRVPMNNVMKQLFETAVGYKIFDFTSFRKHFEVVWKESGLSHFEFNDLRRTLARAIYVDAKNLLMVQEMPGSYKPN